LTVILTGFPSQPQSVAAITSAEIVSSPEAALKSSPVGAVSPALNVIVLVVRLIDVLPSSELIVESLSAMTNSPHPGCVLARTPQPSAPEHAPSTPSERNARWSGMILRQTAW